MLAAANESALDPVRTGAPPGTEPSPRILIVDDSEDDAALAALEIGRAWRGAKFARVDCADDMARQLENGEWDIVIADHRMPRFDSDEALAVLRRSGRDIPLVIYSGHLAAEAGTHAMDQGARDVVVKSSPGRLLAVLRRELDHARTRRAKESAERLARYDALTGLPNRVLFVEQTEAALAAGGARGTLVFLDLDRFARVNDSFGYPTGDALIAEVAGRLRAVAGPRDVIARTGRDEFAIFVPAAETPAAAAATADAVLARFAAPFTHERQEFFLTCSIGYARCPDDGVDADALLRSAESAMFEAKRCGRNNAQAYRPDITRDSGHRLRLEAGLRYALERDELFLCYQPIVDLRTRRVIGTEALVRWRHPELGVVPPDEFIALADESGLIIPIGEWVLRTACAQTEAWRRRFGIDLFVAVNVSAAQFRDASLPSRVGEVLAATHLPPGALEMEITETVAMEQAESTIDMLHALERMGVRISIDDFGTGYSSLAYLKRFPIAVLKIDKSFVSDVTADPDDAAIARTIAALARSLRLQVHAEGVETAAQADFLAREGCDRIQGYWIAKPLPADDLAQLLATRRTAGPHAA